uniref:Uncharacterized protein n=1 Tax=Panagrellus redivivus TaxID=6233 RepID=A0A7E4ZS18_PANRE
MSRCLTAIKGLFFIPLTLCCIALFILQSIYFGLLHSENSGNTESTRYDVTHLPLPQIVICNKIPYNKAGLSSVNSNLNQAYILQYLQQWLDPSYSQMPGFEPLSMAQVQQAENVLQGTFSAGNRVQRLQTIMNQCQDVINSCSFAGNVLSSFECCQFIRPYVGTLNGFCWTFDNEMMVQNQLDLTRGLTITFQVSRNSFFDENGGMTTHPGIEIYFVNNTLSGDRIATELTDPIILADKEGVRARIHQQFTSDLRRYACGQSPKVATETDKHAQRRENSLAACLITTTLANCGCTPLFASFLNLDPRFAQFMQQVNQSTACTVSTFDSCARQFMNYATPQFWEGTVVPHTNKDFVEAIERCRHESHVPCQRIEYPSSRDVYRLPSEYQSSTDYVSRLTVVYDSFTVTNYSYVRNPNLYLLLSYIGYNAALWFTIGHIIWTVVTTPCDWICGRVTKYEMRKRTQVSPISSTAISPPTPPARHGQLPPIVIPPPPVEAVDHPSNDPNSVPEADADKPTTPPPPPPA